MRMKSAECPEVPATAAPVILLVTGLSGSGKTTLANAISPRLRLPLIAKDAIKESLFDTLGWSDRSWSRKLGMASWELFWMLSTEVLRGGGSLIAEGNMHPDFAASRIVEWRDAFPVRVIELHCVADRALLVERFRVRAQGPARHPGHVETDPDTFENEFVPRLLTEEDGLVSGTDAALTVDTTEPASIDIDAIIGQVAALLWPGAGARDVVSSPARKPPPS